MPDIDWATQFRWKLSEKDKFFRHRTFGHNIWFMLIISIIGYLWSQSIIVSLGIMIGILSHLVSDSFTVSGVSWLWPYKDKEKFYFKGTYSMTDESKKNYETILQSILFGITGYLFLSRNVSFNLFSLEGAITFGILIYVGYIIMKRFDRLMVRVVRNIKI